MTTNVLIVDDSLTVRMDLAEAFDRAGMTPLPCADFAQARGVLTRERVDVAVLDVVLPDGDGVELMREVREKSAGRNVPVLLLSSEVEVRDRVRGFATGADEYVGKPYDIAYVVGRIRELVRERVAAGDVGRLVLCIDDSATMRAVLRQALEAEGYRVATATSGEEGLRAAATERPDAIVVDGVLPGMDGTAVIRHVRLDAALRGVPCLLLTEAREMEAELRALDSGADAFVHKGDDIALILAKLRAVLRQAGDGPESRATRTLLGPRRILTVDDSVTYREQIAAALRGEGYDVVQASSGEEALELLSVQPVDCVLLDLMMPGIGGAETCQRIKSSPVARDIPVLVLTAREDRDAMIEGLAMGADDYIQKSAELDVLKARVRAQLRRRQFEDDTRSVRERLLLKATEARVAREAAEARAVLIDELSTKNRELDHAYKELKATQSQLVQSAKMASLGALVAGIAHEINNPLAFTLAHLRTVRNLLSELGAPSLPDDVASAKRARAETRLAEISLGFERIGDLVLKLRTFSRLDEGERKNVSFRECLDSVLTILSHRIKPEVSLETALEAPDRLECYPGLLNQALMNLIANSLDAVGEHGALRIATQLRDGDYRIAIEDTGPGIPEALRERVFEPFFTTKPVGQGTGLGLSITYSIIQKHGGRIALGERPGGGSIVTLHLPFEEGISS